MVKVFHLNMDRSSFYIYQSTNYPNISYLNMFTPTSIINKGQTRQQGADPCDARGRIFCYKISDITYCLNMKLFEFSKLIGILYVMHK